ncbi:NuoE2 NADH I CHAIN E [Moritella sp. PE36]|uniref:NADH-quinone oxidoreductase subunit NuoE family protein n=1 Tax=Moritella sp. PE36 TaxID=58051 RepID=UPI000156842D|nr:NAD(P)H-dependent oxidoreductase subunit E [Moritella sp. PE36]EDM67089.1 NuoE2 NADH I CHAIN E [Moritella sp. PE36]
MTAAYSKQDIIAELTAPIADIVKCYPTQRSAIMPALYLAQDTYGFLDETAYRAIAEILDIPEIWVFELASFYTLYKNKKIGKYNLQLCTNVPCMLRGAYDLLGHLQTRLGINKGDTSTDGLFTLTTVECIGSCDLAPAMMVNETYHTNLSKERVDKLLDQLSQSSIKPSVEESKSSVEKSKPSVEKNNASTDKGPSTGTESSAGNGP